MSLQDVISCPRFVGLTARPRAAIRSGKACRRTGGLRSSFVTAVLSWRHGVGRLRRTVARPSGALGGVVEQASDSPHKFRASRTLVRYPPRRASSDKAGADIMSYRTFSSARTEQVHIAVRARNQFSADTRSVARGKTRPVKATRLPRAASPTLTGACRALAQARRLRGKSTCVSPGESWDCQSVCDMVSLVLKPWDKIPMPTISEAAAAAEADELMELYGNEAYSVALELRQRGKDGHEFQFYSLVILLIANRTDFPTGLNTAAALLDASADDLVRPRGSTLH